MYSFIKPIYWNSVWFDSIVIWDYISWNISTGLHQWLDM